MAKKTIFVSDLTGEEIKDGQHAQVAINFNGSRYALDVNAEEVKSLLDSARKGPRRGRPKA